MRKYLACAALLLVLLCTACGSRGEDRPPPDLTGAWVQDGWEKSGYYQFAIIRDGEMLIYWYKPEERSRDLYWAGTYPPPETGKEPYEWISETRRSEHREANRFTLVDETKTFIYKNDELMYDVMMSHLKMAVSMRRLEDLGLAPEDVGIPASWVPEPAPSQPPPSSSPADGTELPEDQTPQSPVGYLDSQTEAEPWTPPPAPPNQLQ
ncbi:MAG: hypothetical protein IJT94_05850 [Oscillibacter sp.]|nr:hypothetical protein [Oscillibacter sp.]